LKTFGSRIINSSEMIYFSRDMEAWGETKIHTHDFVELEYIYSGRGIQEINGVEHEVTKGDVLFLQPGDAHSYRPMGRMSVINCIFLPKVLEELGSPDYQKIPLLTKLSGNDIFEFERLLLFMEQELANKQYGYVDVLKSYLGILLTRLFRYTQQTSPWSRKMQAVIEYIHANYRHIKPADVVAFSAYNQSYISKRFREEFGMTITAYIGRLRVEEAIRLLCDTDLSVEQVGVEVGFRDKKNFYKAFKDVTGTTPNVVRKRKKNNAGV